MMRQGKFKQWSLPGNDMTDLVLRDIDPVLVDRIRRISMARGWTQHQTVVNLLEQGLFASEHEVHGGFQHPEVDALADAIAALKQLPAGADF